MLSARSSLVSLVCVYRCQVASSWPYMLVCFPADVNLSLLCRTISDRLPKSTLRKTSSLVMWSRHDIPKIVRRHLWWKTSNFWRMTDVLFQVSQACRAVGMTMDVYRRSLVSRLMEWLDQILRRRWKVDVALPILFMVTIRLTSFDRMYSDPSVCLSVCLSVCAMALAQSGVFYGSRLHRV